MRELKTMFTEENRDLFGKKLKGGRQALQYSRAVNKKGVESTQIQLIQYISFWGDLISTKKLKKIKNIKSLKDAFMHRQDKRSTNAILDVVALVGDSISFKITDYSIENLYLEREKENFSSLNRFFLNVAYSRSVYSIIFNTYNTTEILKKIKNMNIKEKVDLIFKLNHTKQVILPKIEKLKDSVKL